MRPITAFFLLSIIPSTVLAQTLAQNESYAPIYVSCPSDTASLTRTASQGLHPSEETWLQNRKKVVASTLGTYLSNAKLKDFDIDAYISAINKSSNYDAVPGIGVAISGGGYASAYLGTGVIRALDGREDFANAAGTGGLLQAMSFYSGQSGGSWAVLTNAAAQFPPSDELVEYWHPDLSRFNATTNGVHAATIKSMVEDFGAKYKAGFNVSVADFLGRLNAYEWLMGPHGGVNGTMSGIKDLEKFQNYEMPMPIVQNAQVVKQDKEEMGLWVPNIKTPIFEFTPWEFGSWLSPVAEFIDIEYLGTTVMDGKPVNESACVKRLDTLSYILGASADAYEFWWLENHSNNTLGLFPKRSSDQSLELLHPHSLRKRENEVFPDVALVELAKPFTEIFNLSLPDYSYASFPNPFLKSANASDDKLIHLVDATEVESSLPLAGQLARNASFIIAWDDDADAWPNGWSNGTNLAQASQYFKYHGVPFPNVPGAATFVAKNWTMKPAFFGCDRGHMDMPLVAWFANAPYSTYSNISYFDNTTPVTRIYDLFNNTYNQITQGANSLDSEWSACLACAAIERSLEKVGMARTSQCEGCFERYCWDGKVEGEADGEGWGYVDVDPEMVLKPGVSFEEWNATTGWG